MKASNILGIASLIIAGALVASCQDDDIVKTIPIAVGNEISFSASASFEKGSLNDKTRTEYGNISKDSSSVALNWVKGDKVEIVCPQDNSGSKQAVYVIADGVEGGIDEGYVGGEADGNSYTSMLKKDSESNLVWGEGYSGTLNGVAADGLHDFYALYPSRSSFTADHEGTIEINVTSGTAEGNTDALVKVTGTMPVAQNPAEALSKISASGETPAHYIVQPDMRYAYMVAQTTVSRYRPEEETETPIQLRFTPLVTALQFDITGGLVDMDKYKDVTEVTIQQLSLSSKSGKSICGHFTYYYTAGEGHQAGECITSNTGTEGYNRITMDLTENGIGGAVLAENEYCDVTFFLLPTVELEAGDLQLTILYDLNGHVQYKTATIGVDLEAKKKYYFKDLKLPPIKQEITGSAWFGAIDDPVYMQQVSIPVAGSAFSNLSDLNGTDISGKSPIYYAKQQTKDYATLWDMGVRGFEFINQSRPDESASETYDMGQQHFICGEQVLDGTNGTASPTFATAFDYLVNFLIDNKTYPDYADECLMLICRYHAKNDGYSPQRYVKNLLSFLSGRIGTTYGSGTLTKDHFVQYTAGLTAGEMKGKIAIIIRPGDDEYMQWANNDVTSSIILTDNAGNDWSGNVTLVQNWGSAYDRWDLRYGTDYGREATWNTAINGGKKQIEDYLYAIVSSDSECSESNFLSGMPTPSTYTSQHVATPSYITPFVQEWQRVVPKELDNDIICTQNSNNGYYLWVRWPESTTERTNAIDATFTASISEKGQTSNNVYINQLSGYYITPRRDNSLEPFKRWFDLSASQSLTRYTPTFGNETKNGESCYIKFSRSDYYISTYSTNGYLYAQQSIHGDSTTYGQQWQLIGNADEFILKDNRGYYVSGLEGDYVTLSVDKSDAARLKLVSRETSSSYQNAWEIQFLYTVSTQGHSNFNQFGGVQGTNVGVWSSDEGCAVYFTPVDGNGEGTKEEIEVSVSSIRITPGEQGNGGNYAELAIDMNTHIYNKIVDKEYGEGPYGMVVMDYIGATATELATCGGSEYSTEAERATAATASTALIRLIYMNNFSFALQRAETTGEGGDDNTETQGASVAFSSSSADAGEPIH